MKNAGVHSGVCSGLPCSCWVRLCRKRSEEEISEKSVVEVAVVQGGASAILPVQAESKHDRPAAGVHGIVTPEKSRSVKNLQRRVWLASACAPGKSRSCLEAC